MDELIRQLTADIQEKWRWWEKARSERSEGKMDVCTHQRLGLQVALGRALALRDNLPQEDEFQALARGCDFMNSLPTSH